MLRACAVQPDGKW